MPPKKALFPLCDAERCAQTSEAVSAPADKLLNPPLSTSPQDPCSRGMFSWEQPPEIPHWSWGVPGCCCQPGALPCKGSCAGDEGDSSWEASCQENPTMCAIGRD